MFIKTKAALNIITTIIKLITKVIGFFKYNNKMILSVYNILDFLKDLINVIIIIINIIKYVYIYMEGRARY